MTNNSVSPFRGPGKALRVTLRRDYRDGKPAAAAAHSVHRSDRDRARADGGFRRPGRAARRPLS